MIPSLKPTVPLRDKSDLARMFGLPPKAPRQKIASAFGRATNFEVWMEIADEPIYRAEAEEWEVKVIECLPRCRLEFRQNGRGAWLKDAASVPEDVWKHVQGRVARDGSIESDRRWKCWEKLNWLANGRRKRSRHGEIIGVIEIPSVRRETGSIKWEVVLEPLAETEAQPGEKRRIALPCSVAALMEAVREMRMQPCSVAVAA